MTGTRTIQNGILITLLSALAYGLYPPASRAIYHDGGNAAFVLWVTCLARLGALVGYCRWRGDRLFAQRATLRLSFLGGALQALSTACILAALVSLPGPIVIAILFTHTLIQLIFMWVRREAKPNSITILLVLLALFAVTLVLKTWQQTDLDLLGIILSFVGAGVTAARMYLFGQETATRPPALVGAETFTITILLITAGLLFFPPVLPHSITSYYWLGLSSLSLGLGTLLMFFGVAALGAFRFSMLAKLEPLFTTLFSVLLIGETLALSQYVGIALLIGSLIAYQFYAHKQTN